MDLNEILNTVETLLKKGHFEQAWKKTNEVKNPLLFEKLGYLFKHYAQWANAVNLFNKALKEKPGNKTIQQEITFLMEILKLEQLDIFASTNLNKDPWLE
ncbi:MAG: hypothetical protein J7L46_01400 [Bacteroidales bacterium]|nr:hypothetical protein [Bacteroidales bacterium]